MKRGKGIVMQVAANEHVIVMTPQGEFLRVPFAKPVHVGQEIYYGLKRPSTLWKWSIAAILLLALASSAGQLQDIPGGLVPIYFITLDINPSVELGVNQKQRVVTAEGLNEAGVQLLKERPVLGYSLKQSLEYLESQAEKDGYLKAGENQIVITFSQDDVVDIRQVTLDDFNLPEGDSEGSNLEQLVGDVIKETLAVVYQVQVWKMPADVRNQVKEAGITPANYIAVHRESIVTTISTSAEPDKYLYELGLEISRPIFDTEKTMYNNLKE